MNTKAYLILSLLALCLPLSAQPSLSLEDALRIGLENNFSIILARQDERIAQNNATPGNAGMLPSVNASGSANRNIDSNRQSMNDGSVNTSSNVGTTRYSAGLSLGWTVFNGMGMFTTLEKLKEMALIGETNSRLTVQSAIAQIQTTYYDIVRRQNELEIMQDILRVSRLRLTNAGDRYEAGVAARLEVLSSRVDYNTDTTALMKLEEELRNAKIILNQLLARDVTIDFAASDSIALREPLEYGNILNKARNENPGVQLAEISVKVAGLTLKEVKSDRFPEIRVSSGLSLGRTEAESGAWTANNTRNLNYGISASVPIFDGFNLQRRIRNAEISRESSEVRHQSLLLSIETQVAQAYNVYERNKMLYELEYENLSVAGENLDAAMERYRVGAISAVQLRDAQRSYLSASNRLIAARYNAKIAEITLLQLSGTLSLD